MTNITKNLLGIAFIAAIPIVAITSIVNAQAPNVNQETSDTMTVLVNQRNDAQNQLVNTQVQAQAIQRKLEVALKEIEGWKKYAEPLYKE